MALSWRRAATTPRTSACLTSGYAPSLVFGETGKLASLVIEKPTTAFCLASRLTAERTHAAHSSSVPPSGGW